MPRKRESVDSRMSKTGSQTGDGRKLKRGEYAQHVHSVLREWILGAELTPGVAIDEFEIAQELGTSRTPVREAMIRLEAEGLLQTQPNKSIVVTPIDLPRIRGLLEACTHICPFVMQLASVNRTKGDLERINDRFAALGRAIASENLKHVVAADAGFHLAIVAAAGNEYFTRFFTMIDFEQSRIINALARGDLSAFMKCVSKAAEIRAAIENKESKVAHDYGSWRARLLADVFTLSQ